MFLGVLPSWIGDLVTVVAVALGLPSLILYFLGRKDANRKLVVEEGGLKVTEVNSQINAYQDLLDRANDGRKEAEGKAQRLADDHLAETSFLAGELETALDVIQSLRNFMHKIFMRYGVKLTAEEQTELDAIRITKDNRRKYTLAFQAEKEFQTKE